EIATAQATLAVKKAEAYTVGETKKREAEAAVLEAQNRAMAKAALAEAEKIEAEQRAALEAPAKGEKARAREEDHRRLRQRPGRLPAPHARAHGRAGRGLGEGDLQHQVRQGRG